MKLASLALVGLGLLTACSNTASMNTEAVMISYPGDHQDLDAFNEDAFNRLVALGLTSESELELGFRLLAPSRASAQALEGVLESEGYRAGLTPGEGDSWFVNSQAVLAPVALKPLKDLGHHLVALGRQHESEFSSWTTYVHH